MKIKTILISALAISTLSAVAQTRKPAAPAQNSAVPRPKLMVGIMVDQMRWDYLYRFYERYGSGGFKRMLNEGFSAENTYINYLPSVTGIGHSTVYTGSVPAIHGIAGNDFIIQATGRTVYCAEDTTVSTVGSSTVDAGQMSPRNLLVTTMTDELRMATNFRSNVIAVASKDRGSILPPLPHALLPAIRARPVNLQAVGTDLEVATDTGKALQIQRTLLELRDAPAVLTDKVVVMVLGQLVARTATKVQPANEPQLREEVQRPVYRHHPDLGTAGPYPLKTLMLLGRDRRQNSQALRRGLVPATTYLPCRRLKPHEYLVH